MRALGTCGEANEPKKPHAHAGFVCSTAPFSLFSRYGASKPLAEKAAWEEAEKLGVDLVTILPGVVFGESKGRFYLKTRARVIGKG